MYDKSPVVGLFRTFACAVVALAMLAPMSLNAQVIEDSGSRKVRNKVAPSYPEIAKRSHIAGVVKIEVVIAPSGTIRDMKVIGGHPMLAGAAQDALKKWKYEPGSSETTTVVEIRFTAGA